MDEADEEQRKRQEFEKLFGPPSEFLYKLTRRHLPPDPFNYEKPPDPLSEICHDKSKVFNFIKTEVEKIRAEAEQNAHPH